MSKRTITLSYLCIALGVIGIILGILSGSIIAVVSSALLTLGGLGTRLGWNDWLVLVLLVSALITNLTSLSYLVFT